MPIAFPPPSWICSKQTATDSVIDTQILSSWIDLTGYALEGRGPGLGTDGYEMITNGNFQRLIDNIRR